MSTCKILCLQPTLTIFIWRGKVLCWDHPMLQPIKRTGDLYILQGGHSPGNQRKVRGIFFFWKVGVKVRENPWKTVKVREKYEVVLQICQKMLTIRILVPYFFKKELSMWLFAVLWTNYESEKNIKSQEKLSENINLKRKTCISCKVAFVCKQAEMSNESVFWWFSL